VWCGACVSGDEVLAKVVDELGQRQGGWWVSLNMANERSFSIYKHEEG
jgi:hypothetical protein